MTPTTLSSVGRVPRQKITSLGTLRACIIGKTTGSAIQDTFYVAFMGPSGKTMVWPLVGVSANGGEACCVILPDPSGNPDRLVVSSRDTSQLTVITEFSIPSNPFLSAPMPTGTITKYGDWDSRRGVLVKMGGGYVASVTVQHTDSRVSISLRAPDGAWKFQGIFQVSDVTGTSHEFDACAAPWDFSLNVFEVKDGGSGIDCAVLQLVNGAIQALKRIPGIVNRQLNGDKFVMGAIAPDGEITALVAVTDTFNRSIKLTYTNDDRVTYPMVNGLNQSHPIAISIPQTYVPSLAALGTELVIAVLNPAPIFALQSGPQLGWMKTTSDGNFLVLPGAGAPWSVTPSGFAFNPEMIEVVCTLADHSVCLIQGDAVTTPTPPTADPGPVVTIPPTPPPPPPATAITLLCNPLASFSWSLIDPTNVGKFTLQWAPSATGPWSDITDHWQISVGSHSLPVRLGDNLHRVDDKYYRLNPKV